MRQICIRVSVILYADDILLIASLVTSCSPASWNYVRLRS